MSWGCDWLRRLWWKVRNFRAEKQRCPDRDLVPAGNFKPWDYWERRDEWYRQCSFCGSIHPEDAIQALRNGAQDEQASGKSYKHYIHSASFKRGMAKAYVWHFSPEQARTMNELIAVQHIIKHPDKQDLKKESVGRRAGWFLFLAMRNLLRLL